ncbi:uncharacterized protein [Porites lutea]|uniref:uncharacterized protein n=1 Tax=Porites lutea TaxID=51062 RepID=UPI003CC52C70
MANSWIGQTVTLLCKADGVPVPILYWYKPDGTKLNEAKAYESTAVLTMNTEHDFGRYNCTADNGFPLASKMIQVKQIKAPSLPNIAIDVQATSMTVKWTVPADNGGSPITAYRVVLLQRDTVVGEKNVTDPVTKTCVFAGLRKSSIYSLRVSARNFVFEGPFSQTTVQTKPEGVPEAALIKDLPPETKDVTVKLMWDEPQNNGAPITKYTVYQRIVNNSNATREWTKIRIITDVSVREVAVKLEKDREYEFLVTASNRFGESVKEEKYTRKIAAVGDVPASVEITDEIILYWNEPDSNGAAITRYSIYQRVGNEWKLIGVINDISTREYVVEIEKGKVYEFVVTATNKYGESSLEENIKWIQALSGSNPAGNQTGSVRNSEGLLHGVYASCILLLLIFTFTLIFLIWKMRLRLELTNSRRKINKVKGKEFVEMEPIATQDEPVTQPSSTMEYDVVVTSATPGSGDYMPLHPSRRSWEITRQQVNIIKVIGKGAFSEVAKATLWNLRENQKVITVAAKMLRANAPDSDRKDLLSELELMKKLKPHPHVIKLMACVTETDPLLVLIEFVPFGDLLGYLRKSRGLSDTYFEDPDVNPQTSLTAEQLMKFAWQVADGMCYLSSRKIIHRDLAARNVLVGEGETCKVTDFGMARNVQGDDIYSKKSRGRLPVKWTAYEALLYGVYTTQSDVWSYGILLYEILTVGGSPYPDVRARQIADRLQEGYRMPRPKHVDDTLYQLMLKCWEEQPTDRPTFNKLRKTMKEMEKKHKTYVNLSQYDNRLYANEDDLIEEEQDEVKSRSATQF